MYVRRTDMYTYTYIILSIIDDDLFVMLAFHTFSASDHFELQVFTLWDEPAIKKMIYEDKEVSIYRDGKRIVNWRR
jgi:hypothetical protein